MMEADVDSCMVMRGEGCGKMEKSRYKCLWADGRMSMAEETVRKYGESRAGLAFMAEKFCAMFL